MFKPFCHRRCCANSRTFWSWAAISASRRLASYARWFSARNFQPNLRNPPKLLRTPNQKTLSFQLGNAEVQGCELLGVPQEVPSNLPNGRLCWGSLMISYANPSHVIFWRVSLGTAWSGAPFETEITEAGTVDVSCACAAPCSSRDQRWKTERFQLGNAEVQGCELLGVPQEVPSNLPNGWLCWGSLMLTHHT